MFFSLLQKTLALMAISLAFLGAKALAAQVSSLNLRLAVEYALNRTPAFLNARETAAISELKLKNSVSSFLPSLDLSSTQARQGELSGISKNAPLSNAWASDLSLGLTENLYDNHVSITNYRIAKVQREIDVLNLVNQKNKVTLEVSTAFYTFSLNLQIEQARQELLKTLERQFKLVTTQYRQGLKSRQDFLRMKTQVQRAELELTTAQTAVLSSETELRRLLAVPPARQFQVRFTPIKLHKVEKTSALFPKTAPSLENYYDYRASELQRRINDLNESFVRRKYWPQIDLSSSLTYDNSNYLGSHEPFSDTDALGWKVQLTLTYNIWDWGARRRNVEIAERQHAIEDNNETQRVQNIKASIDNLMLDLKRIESNFLLSQELLDISEKSFDEIEAEYQRGRASYLDLITGLNDLVNAKINYATVYYSLLENKAKYDYYDGTLYEKIIKE